MDIEAIRLYCLAMPNVEEGFPFGEGTLVFKVEGKIFLLLSLDEVPSRINVKCDPDLAIQLRETHETVLPGYHMNKKHWNTIIIDGSLSIKFLKEQIDHSYHLVAAKKKKSTKAK